MSVEHEEHKHQHQQQQQHQTEASQSSHQSDLTLLTEIIVEILSRLPVDSLLRCRSVCKSWCSIISSPHFVKYHLTLSTRSNHYAQYRLIFSIRRRTILKSCHLNDVLYDSSVNALNLDCSFKSPRKSVRFVGSCNGLVCIYIEDDTLVIWNPSTRKSFRLPYSRMRIVWSVHYGFGYDESTDDYKVVEMCCKFKERYKHETMVNIYLLRNGNWKSIGVFPHGMLVDYFGKFLNGALHWAADDTPMTPTAPGEAVMLSFNWNIISLDSATETYREVLQPVYDEGERVLTLGTVREWLCVLCNYRGVLDLWVMTVYGVKDSWTKLVSIPYLTDPGTDRFSVPLCISGDGKFLFQFGSKLVVYDSKNSLFSEVQNNSKCIQASTFVESLVSPMPAAGLGDRS